jgi:hypothetical protein
MTPGLAFCLHHELLLPFTFRACREPFSVLGFPNVVIDDEVIPTHHLLTKKGTIARFFRAQ